MGVGRREKSRKREGGKWIVVRRGTLKSGEEGGEGVIGRLGRGQRGRKCGGRDIEGNGVWREGDGGGKGRVKGLGGWREGGSEEWRVREVDERGGEDTGEWWMTTMWEGDYPMKVET